METITKEMQLQLSKALPNEAVTKHPTKTYLSSIKAIYVVERLNDVFGVGSWKTRVEKDSVNTTGMVVVKLIFEIPEYGIYHESFGGNDNGSTNNKNFDLGDAFKGATTDALTKICSYLGIGMSVFKGMGNVDGIKPTVAVAKPIEVLTELTKDSPKFERAKEFIRTGEGTIKQLQKSFILSDETIKLLTGN